MYNMRDPLYRAMTARGKLKVYYWGGRERVSRVAHERRRREGACPQNPDS